MAEIFISFIHEEEKVAEAMKQLLREKLREIKKDIDVFLSSDTWNIYAGEDWLKRIKDELVPARVVVLLLSRSSVSRPWINFEAGAAWLSDKKIIPVCFGQLDKGKLRKPYSNFQALSLNDHDGPYYLVRSICHYLTPRNLAPTPFMFSDPGIVNLRSILKEFEQAESAVNDTDNIK